MMSAELCGAVSELDCGLCFSMKQRSFFSAIMNTLRLRCILHKRFCVLQRAAKIRIRGHWRAVRSYGSIAMPYAKRLKHFNSRPHANIYAFHQRTYHLTQRRSSVLGTNKCRTSCLRNFMLNMGSGPTRSGTVTMEKNLYITAAIDEIRTVYAFTANMGIVLNFRFYGFL